MATIIIKQRVSDFERWKTVFDAQEPGRRAYGWTGHEVYRDAADPNLVTVVSHAIDPDRAKQYSASPALRAAMKDAGVQWPPEVTFVDEADHKAY